MFSDRHLAISLMFGGFWLARSAALYALPISISIIEAGAIRNLSLRSWGVGLGGLTSLLLEI